MKTISLNRVLPQVFKDEFDIVSEVWYSTLNFEKNQTYLIKANSGAGKSSLCSFIYGSRKDYLGQILFDDLSIDSLQASHWDRIHRTELSILFQELCLFPELTALENIQLKNNLTRFKTDSQIEALFEQLNLGHKMNSLVAHLSWGQQQRVAIIRALCQPFDFLMMDEPISHLDDGNSELIARIIEKEQSGRGSSVIVTSIGKHLPLQYSKVYSL